jgi:hypothetical protein
MFESPVVNEFSPNETVTLACEAPKTFIVAVPPASAPSSAALSPTAVVPTSVATAPASIASKAPGIRGRKHAHATWSPLFAANTIADYASEGETAGIWAAYDGTQQGDPAKLGKVLVRIANMENPLTLYVAGSDAIAAITPGVEERLRLMKDNMELSGATDGVG